MQQANSSLSTADGSAFELVEDRDDEDAEENDDIRYAEVDESPIEEDEEPDPQIIIASAAMRIAWPHCFDIITAGSRSWRTGREAS